MKRLHTDDTEVSLMCDFVEFYLFFPPTGCISGKIENWLLGCG